MTGYCRSYREILGNKREFISFVCRIELPDLTATVRPRTLFDGLDLNAMPPPLARKLGLPDYILPDDVRNDLYLTIIGGELDRKDRTQNRNVEVQVSLIRRKYLNALLNRTCFQIEVCDQFGRVIPDAIVVGTGGNDLLIPSICGSN